ncbi:hypothetical protein [Actinacidiphila soli]|uniref:hypothetical protein n=1 Tax=Actinacidiphila soli TaxID=2487275 RepID=UPI000FCC83CB|nr:hypothetical protein [Actinacidiphila soli]
MTGESSGVGGRTWRDRRGERSATQRPPFALTPTGKKVPMAPKFERYELVAADGTYVCGASEEVAQ